MFECFWSRLAFAALECPPIMNGKSGHNLRSKGKLADMDGASAAHRPLEGVSGSPITVPAVPISKAAFPHIRQVKSEAVVMVVLLVAARTHFYVSARTKTWVEAPNLHVLLAH